MVKYMVVTRTSRRKGGKYAGSWHSSKAAAHKFGKSLRKYGVKKYVVTKNPKGYYKF